MDYNMFIDELASDSSAPGGGSASAMAGIIAASLTSMVAGLTLNKKGYESKSGIMKDIITEAGQIRNRLEGLMEEDTDAFLKLMDAMKMPKGTQDEKDARKIEIERSMKGAIVTPWKIASQCHRIMRIGFMLLREGNSNAITDAGASMKIARAAIESSLLNVKINISYIKNEKFKDEERLKMKLFLEDVESIYSKGMKILDDALGGP